MENAALLPPITSTLILHFKNLSPSPHYPRSKGLRFELRMAPLSSRCTNRRGSLAEPEVWFRIVHITLEDPASSTTYVEQTVEIALGPKGAFENESIGTMMRRVPSSQVVSAIPPPRGKPRPPKAP